MRQIAYPAAVGGCVLGVSSVSPLHAAEWSITPNYSSSVDYDSDRRLLFEGKGSGATVLTIDLKFKRALEDMDFTLEPHYAWRRFTDPTLGNGDDRSISGGFNWTREKSTLSLNASYLEQSTLIAELLETGITSANTHRRTKQAGASWNWSQTERRLLIAQLSYTDVGYYGQFAAQFPGFRYPSASVGERFFFSERGSFTLSTYGSILSSSTPGNSSHEAGLQAEIIYAFSERTNVDASVGESSRVLTGQSSYGTDASITLTHSYDVGKASLGYTRSLVPYGIGFLVQQQQLTASLSRSLSPYWDCTLAFVRVQGNRSAVLLQVDRPDYNDLNASLNWHFAETWWAGVRVDGIRTQAPGLNGPTINSWRSSLSLMWSPFPKSRSW
jgi:hypothetical protein